MDNKEIIFNNKKYISSGQISKEFNYELSHIAFLARTKKINAIWSGKRWYIDRNSISDYIELAKENRILGGIKSQSKNTPKGKYFISKNINVFISFLIIFLSIFIFFKSGALNISLNPDYLRNDYGSIGSLTLIILIR